MSTVKFYIGALIDNESEHSAIRKIVNILDQLQLDAVLLVNFHVKSRQIDLVIGLVDQMIIVEIKGVRTAIEGSQNGDWKVELPTGGFKTIRNYYDQILNNKYAIKDAFSGPMTPSNVYPNAMLLFEPRLHPNSKIVFSDIKVQIRELSHLINFSGFPATPHYTNLTCQQFALKNNLIPIEHVEALADPAIYKANKSLNEYVLNYQKQYESVVKHYVDVQADFEGKTIDASSIIKQLSSHQNLLILGPSGCGKTLLAKKIGLILHQLQKICVYVELKYFEYLLNPLLDREVGLLGYTKIQHLLKDATTVGSQVVIIVDGLNECEINKREKIIRSLNVMASRYITKLIIITQTSESCLQNLNAEVLTILHPNNQIKNDIALHHCSLESLNILLPLIEECSTGIEVKLAAELHSYNVRNLSRFQLYDLFTRSKLLDEAANGIYLLNVIGAELYQDISFSMSIRKAESLITKHQLKQDILQKLISANILELLVDRISFSHETFLNTYAAESIVRFAEDDEIKLDLALKSPKSVGLTHLIIGAIDSKYLLDAVLSKVIDNNLIVSSYLGACGVQAKNWVKNKFPGIFKMIREEMKTVEFTLVTDEFFPIQFKPETIKTWCKEDLAFVQAIPILLLNGHLFSETIECIEAWGKILSKPPQRLIDEGLKKKIGVRDNTFRSGHLTFGGLCPAITLLIENVHNDISIYQNKNTTFMLVMVDYLNSHSELNFTQIRFLLCFIRYRPESSAQYRWIKYCLENWRSVPYILKLDILRYVGHCYDTDDQRMELVVLVEKIDKSNYLLNSLIIEALQALEALEEDEIAYNSQAKHEIRRILDNLDNENIWIDAYGIYSSIGEHPYSASYDLAISNLSDAECSLFYHLALKGATTDLSLFYLMRKVAKEKIKEDGLLFQKWTIYPTQMSYMPDSDIKAFFTAHWCMGYLGYHLESKFKQCADEKAICFTAIGEIIYALNRKDINMQERLTLVKDQLLFLKEGDSKYIIDGLKRSNSSLYSYSSTSEDQLLINVELPDLVASICRKALLNSDWQCSIFSWHTRNEIITDTISMLGDCGNSLDIVLLKRFTEDPDLGVTAVRAIKNLQ